MNKKNLKENQIRQLEGALLLVQDHLTRNFNDLEIYGEVCTITGNATVQTSDGKNSAKLVYDMDQLKLIDSTGKNILSRYVRISKVSQIPTALGNFIVPTLKNFYL